MVVQTHGDQTTVLLQPLSQSETSVVPVTIAVAVALAAIMWSPVGQLGSAGSKPSLIWWVVGIAVLLIAAGVAVIGGMRPQVRRQTSVDRLKQDIIDTWASNKPSDSLPREPVRSKSTHVASRSDTKDEQ
jgi:hypothetical protein